MSFVNALTASLKSSVQKVLDSTNHGLLEVEVTLSNARTGYEYKIPFIERYDVVQNFTTQVADVVDLDFFAVTEEYVSIMKNSQDLKCRVVLHSIHYETLEKVDRVHDEQYMVVIKNKNDILKQFPIKTLMSTEEGDTVEAHKAGRIPMELQLILPELYDIIKVSISGILRDTNMEDMLHFIATLFKIEKVAIVTPDNVRKYENFIIPATLDFLSIFNYLQTANNYGIYDKGLEYYYTKDTLYIYPNLDMDINAGKIVNIVNVPESMYTGLHTYHSIIDGNIFLLSNGATEHNDIGEAASENDGSTFIIANTDRTIDNWCTTTGSSSGRKTKIHADNMEFLQAGIEGISRDKMTAKFVKSGNNKHVIRSKVITGSLDRIRCQWAHAVPGSIDPHDKIMFHYDSDEKYTVTSGQCSEVIYSIVKADVRTDRQFYTCSAELSLMVEKD